MYIEVRLIIGFQKPLTYKLPEHLADQDLSGSIVSVPLRAQKVLGIVQQQYAKLPFTPEFTIKTAHSLLPFPQDAAYLPFLQNLGSYYQLDHFKMVRRVQQFLSQKEVDLPADKNEERPLQKVTLTPQQQTVVDGILPSIQSPSFIASLIHGVTGSGKTEIYKKLLIENFAQQKTSLFIVPEVTLALKFANILRSTLPHNIPVLNFHSGSSAREKKELWSCLLNHQPVVIVGVHLPPLLPIGNLGLIIIDEEHETGFQEKKHPRLNTKEVCLLRAQQYKIPIVLGSATPSITSLYNVKKKGWKFYQLTKRFKGSFPTIKTVYLDKQKRRNFWISKELEKEIQERLEKKEQAIIFINRRGYSFFVQCKPCSFIFECDACSVSLTYHAPDTLSCHYCNHRLTVPAECPSCKKKDFIKKGIGTEQIVSILKKLFPQAQVAKADMDNTVQRKKWQQTVEAFQEGSIDILVGTQTITKGYHFPKVTLVGIIWADLNLHFPVYNAAETTLHQLIQVAGRAGRESNNSTVIVQAMEEHPVFNYLNEVDYLKFYQQESSVRELMNYPPAGRFCEIELVNKNKPAIEAEATKITATLHKFNTSEAVILGPSLPPIHKIKHSYRRKIYIKAPTVSEIITLFSKINQEKYSSSIYFTPNPQ